MMHWNQAMASTGWWNVWSFLYLLLVLGLVILVYLWALKLYRELPKKRR